MTKKNSLFNADLLHGPIFRSLMLFSIPLLISSVFQRLYATVDTMIVGRVLGDHSLAAIGSTASIYELLVGFAIGIGNGLAIVTARSYGSGDEKLIKKSVASSIVIGVACSIIITIVGSVILIPLMKLLDTPVDILQEAYSYIAVVVLFTVVMFAYNLAAGLLRAVGNSVMPLVFLIISSTLNIWLDYVCIVDFHMGIAGAAYATVFSQFVSAILCFVYIVKKCRILIPSKEHFILEKELTMEMLGQGLSMGFMGSIVALGSVILQKGINNLGTLVIAGHTAARKLFGFFNMPYMALATSMSTFVSQNKGANQKERILQAMRICYVFDLVVTGVITVVLMLYSRELIAFLSGSTEEVVLSNGSLFLRIVGPFYAVLGVLLQTRHSLQGIGAKSLPLISSIIELIGKILFVIFLIPSFGYIAVALCEPVIWIFMTIQLVHAFYTHPYITGKQKKQRGI
ncbi:MAG: MATE family efflux transporter [Erysipelotrichaceae bacterium]|nr:MATE family efflux transporter [Erysipelotrichaceae bacterium]